MKLSIRARLSAWYVAALAGILLLYVAAVLVFQYAQLERQMYHDEVQDMETVEGLLRFRADGALELEQDYFVRPQNRLLLHRFMQVEDASGAVLYRSPTLRGQALGGAAFAGEGEQSFAPRTIRLRDGTRVLLISHVHPLRGRPLLIRLGYSMAPVGESMRHFFGLLIVALPVALLAAGLGGYQIARHALSPLDEMASRAARITARNLGERLAISNPHDELGHVAGVLNHLLDRLERSFAELQRFTANAAHELRTPLVGIRVLGEAAIERAHSPDELREAVGRMLEKTNQLTQTIDGLLLLARTESEQAGYVEQVLSLPEVVAEVIEVLGVVIEEREVSVLENRPAEADHQVCADRSFVRIAVLNVLHNALKFSPPRSAICISYEHRGEGSQAFERMVIEDAGPGIAPGEHERVLERFFTSRSPKVAAETGSGLGLSIAKLALERSGGHISFDPASPTGARCYLDFPALPSAGS